MRKNMYFYSLKVSTLKILLTETDSNFIVAKPSKFNINQWSSLIWLVIRYIKIMYPLIGYTQRVHHFWGIFYGITDWYSFNVSRSWKMLMKEGRNHYRLKVHREILKLNGYWIGSWNRKVSRSGKTSKIWIKTTV